MKHTNQLVCSQQGQASAIRGVWPARELGASAKGVSWSLSAIAERLACIS